MKAGPDSMMQRGPRRMAASASFGGAGIGMFLGVNESNSINLSTLMMNDGSGLIVAPDRGAGTRAARIVGEANRDKGGDHTCAFS